MKNLIKDLVESYGPTGFETEVTNKIRTYIADKVDECYVDALGNLIARKKGSGKKVMFSAHADEIGVIVTYIDDDGFLRFSNVGGLNLLTLLGGRVRFANGVIGVIGKEKGELKDLTLDKLFIDIGAATKDEAQKKVSIGDFAVFHREFADLGQRLVAKSMDDRIGCAVLVEAIRRLDHSDHDLYFVFSAQEEVGLRGARTAAYSIDPDLGIAIDVTRTGDTPEAPRMDVSLGKGAAIKVKDSSVIAHPKGRTSWSGWPRPIKSSTNLRSWKLGKLTPAPSTSQNQVSCPAPSQSPAAMCTARRKWWTWTMWKTV